MWSRIVVGTGLVLLGYYIGKQVERDAPTREWLRERREQSEPQASSTAGSQAPPPSEESSS